MPASPQGQQRVVQRVHSSMSTEQVRDMRRTFKIFDKALDGYEHLIVVPPNVREEAARHAVRYHFAHLGKFNIEQTEVDPYKAATWYGYFIWDCIRDKGRTPLVVTIYVLNSFLGQEPKKVRLDTPIIEQIVAFAKKHEGTTHTDTGIGLEQSSSEEGRQLRDGDEDHAIGKVGIYTAFTAARRALELYHPLRG
jgi:hypothetical protein